jgi:hypothetical protein
LIIRLCFFTAQHIRTLIQDVSHAFDQFGDALHQQKTKAQWNQHIGWPANQAPGVLRHFAAIEGLPKEWPAQPDADGTKRNQNDENANDVDPVAGATRQLG